VITVDEKPRLEAQHHGPFGIILRFTAATVLTRQTRLTLFARVNGG
jgi:hypothetical protein